MKFEHTMEEVREENLMEVLKLRGSEGWELVSTEMRTMLYERMFYLFFKREIVEVKKGGRK